MGICDTSIRIRIDSATKEKAAGALERMGLSVSDAVRMLLVRVGESGRLPFAVEIPNAATRASIAELEAGKGTAYDNAEEMFRDIGI